MSGPDQPSTDLVFAALADPTRRDLFLALAGGGPSTATNLAADRSITRQAVRKHLGLLEDAGLAGSKRQGREVLYSADPAPLAEIADWLAVTGVAWERRLDSLRSLFTES